MSEVTREEFEEVTRQVRILYRSLDEATVKRVDAVIKQIEEEEKEYDNIRRIHHKVKMDEIRNILKVGIPLLVAIAILVYFLVQ